MATLDTPAALLVLDEAANVLMHAPHGSRGPAAREYAARLGVSVQSLYAAIKRHYPSSGKVKVSRAGAFDIHYRKRRADAGTSAMSHEEAREVSAYLMSSNRLTGKLLADIETALVTLRANGLIQAGRVDPATGEFLPLTPSAAAKAMRAYGCHPGQLRQPAPKVALSSPHPNFCWEIDPSICVLYYLRGDKGLQAMPRDEFYKNKPANLARVENERVWRYVFVDHTTGAFYVEYVLGAESGPNLCSTFINAIQARAGEPFHGVPRIVMLDPGSANTGAMFRSLCAALGVTVWINKPKQPWVKGSVEKHNDIIERKFEHRLKFHTVESLEQLNEAAWRWARVFQATQPHSRHGMSRFEAWMRITPEQLRIAPAAEICRKLATHAPEERLVDVQLRVSFRGRRYDVSHVPSVVVGQKVSVARNAWSNDSVHVLGYDENERETYYVATRVDRDDWGFESAVEMGEYRALPTTTSDTERAAVERVAMDAATDEEAAAKRRAKALPFGGKLDPYKSIDEAMLPAYLPRRGTATQVEAPAIIEPTPVVPSIRPQYVPVPLTHAEMARGLKRRVEERGGAWNADLYARMAAMWPEGVPDEQLDDCAVALLRGGLRAVAGGAA